MRIQLLSLILSCINLFPSYLEAPFEEARMMLENHRSTICEITEQYQLPIDEVSAVIAPELIRYHELKDFFETKALELAYIQFGADAADFSIGFFQMKPSFAERLEKEISCNELLFSQFCHLIPHGISNGKALREARLIRLKSLKGQLHYACAFYAFAKMKFQCLGLESNTESLRLIAAAYNFGLDQPTGSIVNWQEIKAFPYGSKFKGPQVSYADLALRFYQSFSPKP